MVCEGKDSFGGVWNVEGLRIRFGCNRECRLIFWDMRFEGWGLVEWVSGVNRFCEDLVKLGKSWVFESWSLKCYIWKFF